MTHTQEIESHHLSKQMALFLVDESTFLRDFDQSLEFITG